MKLVNEWSVGERDDNAIDSQPASGPQLRVRGQLHQSQSGEAGQSNLYNTDDNHHHDDTTVYLPTSARQRSVVMPKL